jgi:hypothetical protein
MRIAARYPIITIDVPTMVSVRHSGCSGDPLRNPGLERLRGLRFVFANPELRRHIGWPARLVAYAGCLDRMAHYYLLQKRQFRACGALALSAACAPWDGHLLRKGRMLLRQLPGGSLLSSMARSFRPGTRPESHRGC